MKLVVDFHGSLTKEMVSHSYLGNGILKKIFRFIEKLVNNLGDYAVASSWEYVNQIKKDRNDENVDVVLDGVNLDYYENSDSKIELKKKLGLPLDKIIVSYTGALVPNKGTEYLWGAISDVMKNIQNVHFIIGGFPIQEAKTFIKNNSLEGRITLINPLNYFKLPEILSASDIEYLVEDKVVKEIESKINRRLQSVENDCHLIKNLFSSLPIIRFFDKKSKEATLKPSLENSFNLNPDDIKKLNKISYNGTSRGTLFYLQEFQSPRLPDTYLRYTLPLFTILNINKPSIPRETIYLIPGGGIYYSHRDYPFYSERYGFIIKLYKESIDSKYGIKFTTCFLKSSFLLWYIKNKYDDIDLFKADIFNKLRFPVLNTKNPHTIEIIDSINKDFDIIVKLETSYLIGMNKIKKDEFSQYTEEHNKRVDEVAHHIDDSIYKLIGLSADEIITIENNLRLNDIYLPEKELVT